MTKPANRRLATEAFVAEAVGGGGGAVASVNGQTGVVVLDADDVGAATAADLATKVNSSTYTAGLAAKANTADLATVATSGAYSDLSGKPTIPTAKADVGLGNVDNTADSAKPVSTAQQAAIDSVRDPNALAVGESTISRLIAQSTAPLTTSGTMRLTYFTAQKSQTATQVRVITGATAAGATPTLCRIGVYSVAADGTLTLVGSTANDTALFAAALTSYVRALTVQPTLTAGQRYALGILVVTAAALPTFGGATFSYDAAVAPRLTAAAAGQTDLPATVAPGGLGASSGAIYGVLLP